MAQSTPRRNLRTHSRSHRRIDARNRMVFCAMSRMRRLGTRLVLRRMLLRRSCNGLFVTRGMMRLFGEAARR